MTNKDPAVKAEGCPLCGADASNEDGDAWECGTVSYRNGGVIESRDCLRRQLIAKDVEIASLQARLPNVSTWITCPACGHTREADHPCGWCEMKSEIEKLSGKCGLLMVDAEASAKEIVRLRGIVDEMTTADGVHVRLGSKVFMRMLEGGLHPQEVTVRLAFRVGDCYSTREAAKAAREAKL